MLRVGLSHAAGAWRHVSQRGMRLKGARGGRGPVQQVTGVDRPIWVDTTPPLLYDDIYMMRI